jgi:hypothetical protein
MADEVETDEGMSTTKKVAAGAAVGVAIPAAVTVAKKLLGDDDQEVDEVGEKARQSRSGGGSASGRGSRSGPKGKTARKSGSRTGSSSKSRSGKTSSGRSSAASSRSRSGPTRTKEQLYATAKRLKIEGRSKMSKTQLERAVEKARS